MKNLILALVPLLLIGCAAQNTASNATDAPAEPEIMNAALEQCVLDCETVHAGQVRACVRRPVTEGRSGMMFNRCLGESYTALGTCYSSCSADEE